MSRSVSAVRMTGVQWLICVMASASWVPGGNPAAKMAVTAAFLGLVVYALGLVFSRWLPEVPVVAGGD